MRRVCTECVRMCWYTGTKSQGTSGHAREENGASVYGYCTGGL